MKKLALLAVLIALAALVTWRLNRSPSPVVPPVAVAAEPVKVTPTPAPAVGPNVAPAAATLATPAPAAAAEKPADQVSLMDLLQPGNRIYDAKLGLMMTYPADWGVRDVALRWGKNNGENTVFFAPPGDSAAVPSMYYRKYADGPAFDIRNAEATLRDMARQKEESRSSGGQNDYQNDPDSFVFSQIDGHPSLSYFATYSQGAQVNAEYFMRILGPTGYVMFFVRGPVKDVQALIPTVHEMGGTVKPP